MPNKNDEVREYYLKALLRVRSRAGYIEKVTVNEVIKSLDKYASRLEFILQNAPANQHDAIEYSIKLLKVAGQDLDSALITAISKGRLVSFQDTLTVWQSASSQVAQFYTTLNLPLPAVPRINLLSLWEGVGAPETWKTLLRGHTINAVEESSVIIRQAIIEGIEPTELARRLRRYVSGSEGFDALFEELPTKTGEFVRLDLRKLKKGQKEAAKRLITNASRIAVSEIHNSKSEAEVQSMYHDPYVKAVQWVLAPDRGKGTLPDQCDILAKSDFFGLGAGIYPVHKVPAPPHPRDRCNRMPVVFSLEEIQNKSKRPNPKRILTGDDVNLDDYDEITEGHKDRIKKAAETAVRYGERSLGQKVFTPEQMDMFD